jgi:hypothetical protein
LPLAAGVEEWLFGLARWQVGFRQAFCQLVYDVSFDLFSISDQFGSVAHIFDCRAVCTFRVQEKFKIGRASISGGYDVTIRRRTEWRSHFELLVFELIVSSSRSRQVERWAAAEQMRGFK